MKKAAVLLINFYQKHISPYKKPCCRFYPTCSEYALEAFENYNFFSALFLTVKRIIKCNPFCKGGYDPLPEKKLKKSVKNIRENQQGDNK